MKIVVAENCDLLRGRLVSLLSELPGVEVIGEARNSQEALMAIRDTRADLVTLDIQMSRGNGLDVLKRIKQEERAPVVIMLTDQMSATYRKRCMEAGADFFLDKATELRKVKEIIQVLL